MFELAGACDAVSRGSCMIAAAFDIQSAILRACFCCLLLLFLIYILDKLNGCDYLPLASFGVMLSALLN